MIYFDHNATTDILPQVKEAVMSLMNKPYNASSQHSYGRQAKALLEGARKSILKSLNASENSYELVFTSSGTEANNLIIHGLEGFSVFIPPTEHVSMIESARLKEKVQFISIDKNGLVNLSELDTLLASTPSIKKIVSVMFANNETGLLQDIDQIVAVARKHGALVHTDAVQAFSKIPVDINALNVDFATISSHKIGGIFGAAALVKRKGIEFKSMLRGGKQEQKMRAGTENIPAIVGFCEAAKLVPDMIEKYEHVRILRDLLEEQILSASPNTLIYAKECRRLPNTSCLGIPNVISETQLIKFDMAGVAISAGSACSSGKIEKSHVLNAMDENDPLSLNAIRISLGLSNTKEEVEKFIDLWRAMHLNYACTAAIEKNDNVLLGN